MQKSSQQSEEDQRADREIENGEIIALSAALWEDLEAGGAGDFREDSLQLQRLHIPSIIWTAGPGFTAMRSGQLPMIFLVPEIKPVWDVRIVLHYHR